jgi:hypothetical protein
METIVARRYAFCDFTNIVGFPHPVPTISEWDDYLPRFRGCKDDHPGEHLSNFHKCMLEHNFVHEDVLIKMFRFSLEEHAREWCQSLLAASIHSLKEFHTVFHHYYKNIYLVDFPFDNCCKEFEFDIQHSVSISFVCKDVGDNRTVDTFVLCSNVSSNFDYDIEDDYVEEGEDISSSSESSSKSILQHEAARPSMQDTKVFGSPIYDEYYNSKDDGNFYEQQISSFLSKAFDQQLYHNKNLDPLLNSHGSSGGQIFTSTHNENFSSKPLYDNHTSEVEVNIEQQTKVTMFGYQSTSFFYDPIAIYMDSCFSEVFSLAKFQIKEDGGCKYVLQVKMLLHTMKLSLILFCIQGVFTVSWMLSWFHWKHDFT